MRSIAIPSIIRHFRGSLLKSESLRVHLKFGSCSSRPSYPTLCGAERICRLLSSLEFMASPNEVQDSDRKLKRALETEVSEKEKNVQKRRRKKDSPGADKIFSIRMAARTCDWQSAMVSFRSARDSGIELPQNVLNSMLFVLTSGNQWLEKAIAFCRPGATRPPEIIELEKAQEEVMQYMREHDLMKDEMVYLAQARLSACLGDPDEALNIAKQMIEDAFPARLRIFTPALAGFAERGEMEKAIGVLNLMDAHNLDLTELEFRFLFKACTQNLDGYAQATSILERIGKELTFLEKETIDIIRSYFKTEQSRKAFETEALSKKQIWLVEDVQVDAEGFCMTAGENLEAIDLADQDWNEFLAVFEKLAISRESSSDHFHSFMSWLDQHGPFDIIVDGANVAFHKQNFEAGAFSFNQIGRMMQYLENTYPDRKALLILHTARTRNPLAEKPAAMALMETLVSRSQLYATPVGSNDDWYWLYAALKARHNGLLISNDECRDHIFQLLAPKYFLKWKERHLVRFEFVNKAPTLELPSNYTSCAQQLSNGTWMFPYKKDDDEEWWLCVKPL